jgi:hypothetical protein
MGVRNQTRASGGANLHIAEDDLIIKRQIARSEY